MHVNELSRVRTKGIHTRERLMSKNDNSAIGGRDISTLTPPQKEDLKSLEEMLILVRKHPGLRTRTLARLYFRKFEPETSEVRRAGHLLRRLKELDLVRAEGQKRHLRWFPT